MNYTEIKKNMTQGWWIYRGCEQDPPASEWKTSINDVPFLTVHHNEPSYFETAANAEAIKTAVNSTYGRGINPGAVEDLKNALEYLSEFIIASKAFDTEEKAYLMHHSNAEKALQKASL